MVASNPDQLAQLAGVTGVGWTVSALGYLATVLGFGGSHVTWLPLGAQPLLYLAGACLVATLGLDRLRETRSNRER